MWPNANATQFQLFSAKNIDIFRKLKKTWEENTENSSKNSKLKQKTQGPGGLSHAWGKSDVIKKACCKHSIQYELNPSILEAKSTKIAIP